MSKSVVKPYNSDKSKKEEVAEMFNNISANYDFLNHFLSLGIDHLWRKKAIKQLKNTEVKKVIDIATGTGDFAIATLKLNPEEVIGLDISVGMLAVGEQKMIKKNVSSIIKMQLGDSENIPYESNYFDALTVGFGVRNFENLERGLEEMLRVIRPGGKAVILEFSKPKKFPVKQVFSFYSKYFIPFFGKRISKDEKAYAYLPESVQAFPEGEEFKEILRKLKYKNVESILLSGGIATIYTGTK